MEGYKLAVELDALFFQYAGNNINAMFAQASYSTATYFGKGVETTYDYALYARRDNEVAARWCFAIMRAWFERNIYG